MIEVLFICLMAYLSALSGGSVYPSHILDTEVKIWRWRINFTWLPEVLFSIPFGVVGAHGFDNWLVFLPCAVWAYLWMQTGHWTVLGWDKISKHEFTDRKRPRIEPVVNWIARRLKIEKFTADGTGINVTYSRLFMVVKGFLIGLPAGGIPLAILWPLGYEIGYRLRVRGNADSHSIAELSCGLFAGVSILMAWYMA